MCNELKQHRLVTLEKARFILERSEKLLDTLRKDYEYIDSKITTLRNFLIIGIAVILSTLNFTQGTLKGQDISTELVFLILGSCSCLMYLIAASRTDKLESMGKTADDLYDAEYNKKDLRALILGYLSTHNECVKYNEDLILEKVDMHNQVLWVIFMGSLICIAQVVHKYFL